MLHCSVFLILFGKVFKNMGGEENFNKAKDEGVRNAINKILIRQHTHRYWEVLQKAFGISSWEENFSLKQEAEKVIEEFEDEDYPRDTIRSTIGNIIKDYLKEDAEQDKVLNNIKSSLFPIEDKVWILKDMAKGGNVNSIIKMSKFKTSVGYEMVQCLQADKKEEVKLEKKEILSPAEMRFFQKTNYKKDLEKCYFINEFTELQKGKIISQIIYDWKAGQMLDAMDKNLTFSYTSLINSQIITLFQNIYSADKMVESPKLKESFLKMEDWLDIGSGNWQVTNDIALLLYNYRGVALMQKLQELFAYRILGLPFQELHNLDKKINLTYCDLSWESLKLAKELASDKFYDLEKLYTIKVKNNSFQEVMKKAPSRVTPQLITMLNVLANFEEEDLRQIMKDMYDHIQFGDCFIPTFFIINDDSEQENKDQKEKIKFLYDNKETKERILTAFCERYQVWRKDVDFEVYWDNDGREYVSVDVVLKSWTQLFIPKEDGTIERIVAGETAPLRFNAFKSYRMKKEEIKNLCLGIGFKIDGWLDDRFWFQTAPILYKK